MYEGHYTNTTKAVAEFHCDEKSYRDLISPYIRKLPGTDFFLTALDVTPVERKHSSTLEDRSYVYKSNTVNGKPITIGHNYSQLVHIPEIGKDRPPWVVPLDCKRVPSNDKGHLHGIKQLKSTMKDDALPFFDQTLVCLGDTAYSANNAIAEVREELGKNLVLGVRVKGDRIAFKRFEFEGCKKKGRPRLYSDEVVLNNPHRQVIADLQFKFTEVTARGKEIYNEVSIWQNMIFKGNKDFDSYDFPFTLVRIVSYNNDGKKIHKNPIWVAFYGHRRDDIIPTHQGELYFNRFKIEHFFKFLKQNHLMNDFQTPEVEHEEAWAQINQLAYMQLYASKGIAEKSCREWEKYSYKNRPVKALSPKQVQRDMHRILKTVPRVTKQLIKRGKSPGRPIGFRPAPRSTKDIIVKKVEAKSLPEVQKSPPLEKLFDRGRNIKQDISNSNPPKKQNKSINSELSKSAKESKLSQKYRFELLPASGTKKTVPPYSRPP